MKNPILSAVFLALSAIGYFYAFIFNFFGFWLIYITLPGFGLGTLFLLLSNLNIKQKAYCFLGAIVLYVIPLIYGSFVW